MRMFEENHTVRLKRPIRASLVPVWKGGGFVIPSHLVEGHELRLAAHMIRIRAELRMREPGFDFEPEIYQ